MAKLTFRAKLDYSNPSLIRYFEIDDRCTIDNLIQTVLILFGVEDPEHPCLNWGDKLLPGEDLIEKWLSPAVFDDSAKHYVLNCEVDLEYSFYYGYETYSTLVNMTFSLELETEYAKWSSEKACDSERPLKECDGPKLIKWRGPHLVPYGMNMADVNIKMDELIKGSRVHMSDKGYLTLSDFLPDEESINQELFNRIVKGISKIKLNPERGYPLSSILGCRPVSLLHDIIYNQSLSIPVVQNKDRLLHNFQITYCKSEFWLQLIEKMSPKEYRALVDLLLHNKQPKDIHKFKILGDYGLTAITSGNTYVVPMEFLIWFEKYLNSNESHMLIDLKKGEKVH